MWFTYATFCRFFPDSPFLYFSIFSIISISLCSHQRPTTFTSHARLPPAHQHGAVSLCLESSIWLIHLVHLVHLVYLLGGFGVRVTGSAPVPHEPPVQVQRGGSPACIHSHSDCLRRLDTMQSSVVAKLWLHHGLWLARGISQME